MERGPILAILAAFALLVLAATPARAVPLAVTVVSPASYNGVAYYGVWDTIAVEIPYIALPSGFDLSAVNVSFCDGTTCSLVLENISLSGDVDWVVAGNVSYSVKTSATGESVLLLIAFLDGGSQFAGKLLSVKLESRDKSVVSANNFYIVDPQVVPLDDYVELSRSTLWYNTEFTLTVNISGLASELGIPLTLTSWSIAVVNKNNPAEIYTLYASTGGMSSSEFIVSNVNRTSSTVEIEAKVGDFQPTTPFRGEQLEYSYSILFIANATSTTTLDDYNVTLTANIVAFAESENETITLLPSIEVIQVNRTVSGDSSELNPYDEITLKVHNINANETLDEILVEINGESYAVNASKYVISMNMEQDGVVELTLAVPPVPWSGMTGILKLKFGSGIVNITVSGGDVELTVDPIINFYVLSPYVTETNGTTKTRLFEELDTVVYGDYVEVVVYGTYTNVSIYLGTTKLPISESRVLESGYVVLVARILGDIKAKYNTTLVVDNGVYRKEFSVKYETFSTEHAKILVNPKLVFETGQQYVLVEEIPNITAVTYDLVETGDGDTISYGRYTNPLVVEIIGFTPYSEAKLYFKMHYANLYYDSGYVYKLSGGYGVFDLTGIQVRYLPLGTYTIAFKIGSSYYIPKAVKDVGLFYTKATVDVDPEQAVRGQTLSITIAGCPTYAPPLTLSVQLYLNGTLQTSYNYTVNLPSCTDGLVRIEVNTTDLVPSYEIRNALDALVYNQTLLAGTEIPVQATVTLLTEFNVHEYENATVDATVSIASANIISKVVSVSEEIPSSRIVLKAPRYVVSAGKIPIILYVHSAPTSSVDVESLIEDVFSGGYLNITVYDAATMTPVEVVVLYVPTLGESPLHLDYMDLDGDGSPELVVRAVITAPETENQETLILMVTGALSNVTGKVAIDSSIDDAGSTLSYSYNKTLEWEDGKLLKPVVSGMVTVLGEPKRYYNITIDMDEVIKKIEELETLVKENNTNTILVALKELEASLGDKLSSITALMDERSAEIIATVNNMTLKVEVDPSVVTELYKLVESVGEDVREFISGKFTVIEGYLGDIKVSVAKVTTSSDVAAVESAVGEEIASLRKAMGNLEDAVNAKIAEQSTRLMGLEREVSELKSQVSLQKMLSIAELALLAVIVALLAVLGTRMLKRKY
jgi:hypothetical protein